MSKDHGYTITRCISGYHAATALATTSGSRRMFERQAKYWTEQLEHARKRTREYDDAFEQEVYDAAYEVGVAGGEQPVVDAYINASAAGYWDGNRPCP